MKHMDELKDMVCKELDSIAEKGELTHDNVEIIYKLTDIVKDLYKIAMYEDAENGKGYSQAGDWAAYGTYGNGNSGRNYPMYMNGNSYANGSGGYSRGRSSTVGGGRTYSTNSYGNGGMYSRDDAKTHMLNDLEDMMQRATTDKERDAIQRCMSAIEMA